MATKYNVEVQVKDQQGLSVWRAAHPVGKPPYRFDTEEEAQKARRMMYPDHLNETRVTQVWVTDNEVPKEKP